MSHQLPKRLPVSGGHDIDSRRWTGPDPAQPITDRHAAKAAFWAAGGAAAGTPQRAAAAISWAGLMLLPAVVLAGADEQAWLPGLRPVTGWFRGSLGAWLAPGTMALLGDPRLLALLLALGGSVAGIVTARRHRAALRRGFAVAGDGFLTQRAGGVAPLMLLLVSLRPAGGTLLVLNALALWLIARLAASSLTALAERHVAGAGRPAARLPGWDMTTLVVSLGAMSLLLAHMLRAFG